MKQKLNVVIHKLGNESDVILRMIGNCNDKGESVSARDLEGYLNCRNMMFPTLNNFALVRDNATGEYYNVSEDGGESFTLTIEWCEVYELATEIPMP
jgi:hypothetical protein